MKKKILSIILATAMFASYSVPTFAEENVSENEQTENIVTIEDANDVAELVEGLPEISDINDDIEEEGDGYVIEGESSDLTIIDSEVTVEDEFGEAISMNLPSEFNNIEGELAGEGTVVYNDDSLDASAAVQGTEEQVDGMTFDGFRGLITIENADASHEYDFEFNLPEGCKLVENGGYISIINENNIMVDENGENPEPEILGEIDPAWAQDANGNSIDTTYSINGNVLTQKVEFDENSAFPIVADPNYRTVKDFEKKISGELGNKSTVAKSTKKCVWKATVYKVYKKNISTGKKKFQYREYVWSWVGYKKVNGKWKKAGKSKSGTTRTQNDWSSYNFGLNVLGQSAFAEF